MLLPRKFEVDGEAARERIALLPHYADGCGYAIHV